MAKKKQAERVIELSPDEAVAAFKDWMDRCWNLDRLLDEVEQQAGNLLKRSDDKPTQDDAEIALHWLKGQVTATAGHFSDNNCGTLGAVIMRCKRFLKGPS